MPVHPSEENTSGSTSPPTPSHSSNFSLPNTSPLTQYVDLTDKVAKESSDSTASDHKLHDEDHSHITSGGKASAEDHKSKGPVIHGDLGEVASKDELKKRDAELNSK